MLINAGAHVGIFKIALLGSNGTKGCHLQQKQKNKFWQYYVKGYISLGPHPHELIFK